jgi:hypothetical protein
LLATIGRSTRWFDRCCGLVLPRLGCTVVRADASTGVHHLVAELRGGGQSVVWLKLDGFDADDPVSVGNKFAVAFARAYGSPVFGHGVPIGHTMSQLRRLHSLLGPLAVVVSFGEKNAAAVRQIRSITGLGSSVTIIVPEGTDDDVIKDWSPTAVLEAVEFSLKLDEASDIALGAVTLDDVSSLLERCRGRFVDFVAAVRATEGLPPLLEPEPEGFSFSGGAVNELPPGLLISSLRRRGASMEAFEVCVRLSPELAGDFVADAAPHYVLNGLNRRLLRQLEFLPAPVREQSDDLMRWWFAAHTS